MTTIEIPTDLVDKAMAGIKFENGEFVTTSEPEPTPPMKTARAIDWNDFESVNRFKMRFIIVKRRQAVPAFSIESPTVGLADAARIAGVSKDELADEWL